MDSLNHPVIGQRIIYKTSQRQANNDPMPQATHWAYRLEIKDIK